MSGILPISALLRRELVTQLRRTRSLILLLAVAVMMIWMIAVMWPSGNVVWALMPAVSQAIVTGFSFMLLAGAALFIPGIAATTVVVEKEQRSWDLLALTLLRPSGVIAGKLLSAIGMYLIYVIAVFPILSVVFFLVGIDWVQLSRALALVLVTCVTCGAVGMACSAVSKKTVTAMARSYFGMIVVMGLPSFLLTMALAVWFNFFDASQPPMVLVFTLYSLSPIVVLMETIVGVGIPGMGGVSPFLYNMAYQAAITVVALLVTVWVLRRPAKVDIAPGDYDDPRIPATRLSLRERLRRRRRRFRKPRPPIRDRSNPIFVRELWWGAAGSRRTCFRSLLLLFGVSLALMYGFEEIGRSLFDPVIAGLVLHGILISCLIPVLLAGSFTREYELRSLDMLRMTLVTPRQLIRGKFLAGLRLALLLSLCSLLANAPIFVLLKGRREGLLGGLLAGHVSLFVCVLLAASVALLASAIAKRTSTAVVTSFCFVLFAYFGGPFLLVLLHETVGTNFSNDMAVFLSPVFGYLLGVDSSRRHTEVHYVWWVNIVEFMLVSLIVYYVTQRFCRRYRFRER